MKFSITNLRNETYVGAVSFDELVDVSDLKLLNNDIRDINPVRVKGICTMDKEELVFSFSINGEMTLPCARTLVDVLYPFDIRATEIFTTALEVEEEDEEDGVHQILEETLDLTPYIKENIVLAMPYRVFSDEKAIEGGEGWSFSMEDDYEKKKQETIDPRLAKLQRLLDNDEK